ncbi:MAG: ATP-dependent DNA helicase RecG [Planctomycetota bacterium]|nr:ATP-dependent DNA helicase RecG [Planctomycetota bacterium]
MDPLMTPVRYLKGVGPGRSALLESLGLTTALDVLHHYPRRYEDRQNLCPIRNLKEGDQATICGQITSVTRARTRGGKPIVRARVADESGTLDLIWFGRSYLYRNLRKEPELYLFGGVRRDGRLQMINPEVEQIGSDESIHTNRIVPIYPVTAGISQRVMRKILWCALERHGNQTVEFLPSDLRRERRLADLREAIAQIHFPDTDRDREEARRRLAFDEFFLLEAGLAVRRGRRRRSKKRRFPVTAEIDRRIRRRFPFQLTEGQEDAVRDIVADLAGPFSTYRLIQGDVGSGKTVVALYFLLAVIAHKGQGALMAPTEALADQHYHTVSQILSGSRVRILRLAGGQGAKKRKEDLQKLEGGSVDLVVGTHAVIQGDVRFRRLEALVIDEQHKFGVLQRAALKEKGDEPEVLVMTATPIPRTLSLTLYGDLDLTLIRGMPPGRKPVTTRWVRRAQRAESYRFLKAEMKAGRQVFVVYPLIEESKDLQIRSAVKMYEELSGEVFAGFTVGLLHGRLGREEREKALKGFREGVIQLLVSTIVIEVGIDIPNASVMVVEHAERFGLAQLHQLRGRIGRGPHKSACLLFGDPKTPQGKERLAVMETAPDGFQIAEEDLRIRGAGEFFGTRQSGMPPLRLADPIRDLPLLEEARRDAFRIVELDPRLQREEHLPLRRALIHRLGERLSLADVG